VAKRLGSSTPRAVEIQREALHFETIHLPNPLEETPQAQLGADLLELHPRKCRVLAAACAEAIALQVIAEWWSLSSSVCACSVCPIRVAMSC
jgi:hypothetical protein